MFVLKNFVDFLVRLRFFEASFLSGIPLFAYFIYSDVLNPIEVISLYTSSLFCALSVFSLGEFFISVKWFLLSLCFLLVSSFILLGENIYIKLFPTFIFLNWFLYYLSRRFLIIADVFLHFLGGILQFYFGALFSGYPGIFSLKVFMLASAISFAFTAGYMIDLIQDVEEDKILKQKNITIFLGDKLVFIISSIFFSVAYIIIAYYIMDKGFLNLLFSMLFIFHLISALIVFANRAYINFYRMSYRLIFSNACILILISR